MKEVLSSPLFDIVLSIFGTELLKSGLQLSL